MKSKLVLNKRFNIETSVSTNAFLNSLPKSAVYKRKASTGETQEVDVTARTEISVITTNSIDADREVINPQGIVTTRFLANPVVLYCHDYHSLPIGKCQWLKPVENGIKAKSWYPPRPKDFPDAWFSDTCLALIQAEVCKGKSIGFVELKSHVPTQQEIDARPELVDCKRIIDQWELLEYSVVAVPNNPDAVLLEKISKQFPVEHLRRLGIEAPKPNIVKEVVKDQLKKSGLTFDDLTKIALKTLS